MKIASRFLTQPDGGIVVHLTVAGDRLAARLGDTVAAALMAYSGDASRQTA